MPSPFPSEPLHADINWSEEDNKANGQKYGIWFEDIQSGFAKPHVRVTVGHPGYFIAFVEVQGTVFQVRCRTDLNLTIFAASVATSNDKDLFHKTLSQSP